MATPPGSVKVAHLSTLPFHTRRPSPEPEREVIAWLRVREFQLLSLRMICRELLQASLLYVGLTSILRVLPH